VGSRTEARILWWTGHGIRSKEMCESVFIWCARISLVRLADCEVSAMV